MQQHRLQDLKFNFVLRMTLDMTKIRLWFSINLLCKIKIKIMLFALILQIIILFCLKMVKILIKNLFRCVLIIVTHK